MAAGTGETLRVVMPVFDEEASIERVLDEWLPALRALETPFRLLAIDDGSRDRTPEILARLAAANPELEVHRKANSGHGPSCLQGYRLALAAGAGWVLQLDSDGQCDPAYLGDLWSARLDRPAVFGYRRRRDDGLARWAISRLLSLVAWLAGGTWVRDANVPYRLMRRDALERALDAFPDDVDLVNVLLALRLERGVGLHWVPIRFRVRHGGTGSLRPATYVRHARRLVGQLWRDRGAPAAAPDCR